MTPAVARPEFSIAPPVPDVLGPDWVSRTIHLPPDHEGAVVATLVSAAGGPRRAGAVVYLHGYVDYFFQAGHARRWDAQGFDFYALELRKYGRSLRPHQTPNDVRDLRAYDAEIAAALAVVRAEHDDGAPVVLLGHSTGGLIAALWLDRNPGAVAALVLNSPWLEHNGTWFDKVVLTGIIDVVGRVAPALPVRRLSPHYGRALHVDTGGEWDFDLAWKPHRGFLARAAWARTIRRGHAAAQRGLGIDVPILVCASARSGHPHRRTAALADSDCVVDVADIVRFAPGLGRDVEIVRIDGGLHDLTLSRAPARAAYEAAVFGWLGRRFPAR